MIKDEYYVTPKVGLRVMHKGVINIKALLKEMSSYLGELYYDITEKNHEIKNLPRGNEITIEWRCTRKVDDYAMFNIDFNMFCYDMKEIKDGVYNGNFMIHIKAYVTFDYGKKFKGPLGKFMMNIYNNYIAKDKIIGYYDPKLEGEAKNFQELVKENLGI